MREDFINEGVAILKERYNASLQDLYEAYLESRTVPATIFSGELTPLEAISSWLTQQGWESSGIAKELQRRKSVVDQAIENAIGKGEKAKGSEQTPYWIPLKEFCRGLSPAETVVWALREHYGLGNVDIARLLGKDPRNTHTLLKRADEKLGGERDA